SEFNMEMEKKNIAIIILAVVLAASGIGNVILALNLGLIELEPEETKTVVILKGGGPATLDPVTTWDYDSFDVQLQVLEGLVTYNLSNHPTYEIIPQLATSWGWNAAKDSIWFDLRRGVDFHDGTPFNAEAVKWNFDRVQHFINVTGDLVANETSDLAFPSSLYYDSAGTTPIINSTVVNSEYNVTVNLNFPFVMFLDLITFEATTMVSPASTPKYSYIEIDGDLVGTGPYVYDSYTTDTEVRFHRNEDYWAPLPYFEVLVFSIIIDDIARNIAGLAREGDFIQGVTSEMLPTFNSSPNHIVFQLAEADLLYYYLEFNCQKLNSTWRDALSHAINYTYVIEEILYPAVRSPPAVPSGMPGHNASVVLPVMDITRAREAMQRMGFGVGWNTTYPGTDDAAWSASTFASDTWPVEGALNLNHHEGSLSNQRINTLLAANFALIGVDTQVTTRSWADYLATGQFTPDEMDLSVVGWGPDYLDAFNMLDPLLNNASASNFAQLDDPKVLDWLAQAAITADALARQQIYMKIQSYLFDARLPERYGQFPHAPLIAGTA
ncbi:hypothetical protein LCGC14_2355970, partial [marine sediment metagenome]